LGDAAHADGIGAEGQRFARLGGVVDGEAGGSIEVELDGVGAVIGGADLEAEIGDGARDKVEIAGDGGGEKGEVEVDAGAFEAVEGAGGCDFAGDLRKRVDGRFRSTPVAAQEAVGSTVNANDAGKRLVDAGPMFGLSAGELVADDQMLK